MRCVIESHGKTLTAEAATQALGMRPAEAWDAVAKTLGISATGQELYEQVHSLVHCPHVAAGMHSHCFCSPGSADLFCLLKLEAVLPLVHLQSEPLLRDRWHEAPLLPVRCGLDDKPTSWAMHASPPG